MFRGLIGTIFAALIVMALIAKIGIGAMARRRAARRMHELCSLCERPTQPDVDLYDDKRRAWYHATCRQRFLDVATTADEQPVARHNASVRRQAC